MPLNTTVLRDNASLHDPAQFSKIELLYDSIFEKLAEAIDMKKGLLIDTEEVLLLLLAHFLERSPKGINQPRKRGNGECGEIQLLPQQTAAVLQRRHR